jgi:hypothetical protein
MLVAAIVRNRCCLVRIGPGDAFLVRRSENASRLKPHLETGLSDFLGMESGLFKSARQAIIELKSAEDAEIKPGEILLLSSGALAEALSEAQVLRTLSRMEVEKAANRFVRWGRSHAKPLIQRAQETLESSQDPLSPPDNPRASFATVLVEIPREQEEAKTSLLIPRSAVMAGLGVLGIAAVLAGAWFGLANRSTPPVIVENTPLPTATALTAQPSPTELLLLPTIIPIPTKTPSPTSNKESAPSPTSTPTPSRSPTRSPTLPPTFTLTPSETPTYTPEPPTPTPTETITPSPTIPGVPIEIGGLALVVGTEGLGISIREGPSSETVRRGVLRDGDLAEIIGGPEESEEYIWWQIRSFTGVEGWAVDQFLQGVTQ